MRIAFFGLPLAAVLLASDGRELVYVGLLPEKGIRRLKRILPRAVHLMPDLSTEAAARAVREARPELLVSWFWPRRIPTNILDLAPAVGVHPSLLPHLRGPDPYFWSIDRGDEIAGVSAHLLEERYDTGAVLAQRSIRIEPGWNAWQLAKALDRPGLSLLREIVGAYAVNRPPIPHPQDEAAATMAPKPLDAELAVRWSWSAERIARRVRAAAPWPGMWTEIGTELVVLTQARATGDFPRTLLPAEAAVRRDGVAVVRAGEGALELLEGRTEEGAPLAFRDLARIVTSARDRCQTPKG
jgi:methionyl-tRNA formyltransferase